ALCVSCTIEDSAHIIAGMTSGTTGNFFRGPSAHDLAATFATFRSQIDNPVRAFDHLQIVFNHDHRITRVAQLHQYLQEFLNVGEMQSGGRLIENVERAPSCLFRKLSREFYALGFSAGESRACLAKSKVTQTYIQQRV